jgi:hypothetical protein
LDRSSPTTEDKDKEHGSRVDGCLSEEPPFALKDQQVLGSYQLSVHSQHLKTSDHQWAALIDRGANGCIAGRDMKVIETTDRTIDLSGIDDHTVRNLAIVTAGGVVRTGQGEIIVILHQAADMTRDARTILSSGQMESFGCTVDDRSPHILRATPHIRTSEGYTIPIQFRKGLPLHQATPL